MDKTRREVLATSQRNKVFPAAAMAPENLRKLRAVPWIQVEGASTTIAGREGLLQRRGMVCGGSGLKQWCPKIFGP